MAGAEQTASLIASRNLGVKVIALKVDVSKEADVKAAVDRAVAEFGRLDIMVRRNIYLAGPIK